MPTTATIHVTIEVAPDRLRAELLPGKSRTQDITPDNLRAKLTERGIKLTPELQTRIDEVVAAVSTGKIEPKPILLAEGSAPIPGIGATVTLEPHLHDDDPPPDEGGSADFYRSKIAVVQAGETIGQYRPAVPAQPGRDVFGQAIPGPAAPASMEIGDNIQLADNGTTLIAKVAGKLNINRHEISVLEVVHVDSDVDFSTGNVESPTNVLIAGTVRDGFTVSSVKSVSVRGAIEGAIIQAGTDLEVNGGIAGHNQGTVQAGGHVFTKFCSEANLHAAGDIVIGREAMNSQLYTCGQLSVLRGKLVGGYAYARQGAEIRELGNETDRPTAIAVGVDPQVLAEASEIDAALRKKRDAAHKIREKVAPLLAQLKRLTPQQRERATELMYEADELENKVRQEEARRQQQIADASPAQPAGVLITKMAYTGAKIIFGDKMTLFRKPRPGPIRVERRVVNRVAEIVVIDRCSGSVTIMPSHDYTPEPAQDPQDLV